MMQRNGWKGVHAIDAIAYGDGPSSLSDCVVQEMQWSRSLMILLLTEMPVSWKKLSIGTKAQFLFSELWYPLFGFMLFIGSLLPIIAILSATPWVMVCYTDFLQHSLPCVLSLLGVFWYLRQLNLFRPYSPLLSWEGVMFQLFRWPWAVYGTVSGLISVVFKKVPEFKVTPKGKAQQQALSWKVLSPYIAIILISAVCGLRMEGHNKAAGYFFFLVVNALMYSVLLLTMIILNIYEQKK
jgi:cellulose synthase/poly-beta-1,6-N-acetylglucosamine synthase-like glycosyltransferase